MQTKLANLIQEREEVERKGLERVKELEREKKNLQQELEKKQVILKAKEKEKDVEEAILEDKNSQAYRVKYIKTVVGIQEKKYKEDRNQDTYAFTNNPTINKLEKIMSNPSQMAKAAPI